MPQISVVIPLFNKEKYIERAITSIMEQAVLPHEIIVVDDGSTDNSAGIVLKLNNPLVRLVRQPNGGVSAARNRGISEAAYEYISFLDADDTWKPDFLKTALRLIQKYPGAGAFATAYEVVTAPGVVQKVAYKDIPEKWEGYIDFFAAMLGHPPVWTSATVIPKRVFEDAGYFKVGERIAEDVDMWCRIALKYPIAFSTDICAVYRQDAENRTYIQGKMVKKAQGYLDTLENALSEPAVPAAWKHSISVLRERVIIGYAVNLIFAGQGNAARTSLKKEKLQYEKNKALFWTLLSFIPSKILIYLLNLKSRLSAR